MDKKIFQDSFKLGTRMVTVEAWSTEMVKKTTQEAPQNKEGNNRHLELQ